MADLDRNNNNFKMDDSERMKKKRFSSVLNFFNDIIGKTSSLSSGLDNTNTTTNTNNRYFSVSKRKSKRQASAPDLTSNIDASVTFASDSNKSDNSHKRIAPTISVPASLNLPRAHARKPILSTSSLNKADINEEWLRPTRYRNYRANGNINYYESDLSLDSFANSNSRLNLVAGGGGEEEQGGTLERRRVGLKANQSVRFSFDNLHNNKIDEQNDSSIKRCNNPADFHSLRQPQSADSETCHHRRDLEDALNVLRRLDQNLETQSEKNLLHVGAFVCSVERSQSSSDLPSFEKNTNQNGTSTTSLDKKDPVITVQVDQDEIFGAKQKKRIPRQPRLSSLRNNKTGSLSRSSRRLSSRLRGAIDLDNCFVEVDEKAIIAEKEELQLNDQSVENSFWGNNNADSQALTENEIRKIAENEARQVVSTTDFQERNVKKWTKSITCNVRDKIRAYTGRQFKVVVNAFVGTLVPSSHDTVNVTVRGLTDPSKDRFVVAAFEIDDVFISITCILIRTDSKP